jgi:hypothetical protein
MPELEVERGEFGRWLLAEYRSVFTSERQVEDFLSQGLAFLLASGSSLLKAYILRKVKPSPEWETLTRTASSQAQLWWIFCQTVEAVQADRERLRILYQPKERYKPFLQY